MKNLEKSEEKLNAFLKTLNIKEKLSFGFKSVIIMNLVLAVIVFCGLIYLSFSLNSMIEDNFKLSQKTLLVKSDALCLRRYEKDVFLNIKNLEKVKSYKEKFDKKIDAMMAINVDLQQKFKKLNYKEELKLVTKEIDNMKMYHEGFSSIYQDIQNLQITTPQDGNKAMKLYKDPVREIEELSLELIDNISKKTATTEKQLRFLIIGIIIMVVIISALIFAVAIFISLAIYKSIVPPIEKVIEVQQQVANGNLKVEKLSVDSNDEIATLTNALNKMVDNLKDLVLNIKDSSKDILSGMKELDLISESTSGGAQQVSASITQLATGTQEQACTVTDTCDNANKINSAVQAVSELTQKISESTKESSEKATKEGKEKSGIAVTKIKQIQESSNEISLTLNELGALTQNIGQIVDLIKSIATQTNLLALNAAIEAARAGEQGKGFAVVAEEVKKLANQSAESTDKVTDMIKEIQNITVSVIAKMDKSIEEVKEGVVNVEESGQVIEVVSANAKHICLDLDTIYEKVNSTKSVSDGIQKMMENLSAIVEESAASAEEISSTSQEQTANTQQMHASINELEKIVMNLEDSTSKFTL